ncbi:hypothetical protein [Candidatus Spongiihabitans sp.]|uniref:hypothetical protein n=1 Tax=Candidatus Spongiihabitans sp. TaxID=3101308 RepID=UPI003C6FABF8
MFNSSPITSWEGAGAFFNYAGSGGAVFWFFIAAILCIIPVLVSLKAEKAAEDKYK